MAKDLLGNRGGKGAKILSPAGTNMKSSEAMRPMKSKRKVSGRRK